VGIAERVYLRGEQLTGEFNTTRLKGNRVDDFYQNQAGPGLDAAVTAETDAWAAKGITSKKTAGILYNLGINHATLHANPADAGGTGAQAFAGGDGNNYDLTDERPVADAARGLQAFIALQSQTKNPLSTD
jgi:hypothetical protein